MRTILRQQGYNYTFTQFSGTFANFRNAIRAGRPVMMTVGDRGWETSHFVLGMGFEHFRHNGRDFHYIRIIDGLTTTNAARFVCLNGTLTTVHAACFWIG